MLTIYDGKGVRQPVHVRLQPPLTFLRLTLCASVRHALIRTAKNVIAHDAAVAGRILDQPVTGSAKEPAAPRR